MYGRAAVVGTRGVFVRVANLGLVSSQSGPSSQFVPPPPRHENKPAGIRLSGLFTPSGATAVWRRVGGWCLPPGSPSGEGGLVFD